MICLSVFIVVDGQNFVLPLFLVMAIGCHGFSWGWASNHAMMHAIGLTLSSLYFNCILGSYLENLLEACGLASSLV